MRRILCMGGHDFTTKPEDRALTDLIATLAGDDEPRVCLLPTASGDAAEHTARFLTAFSNRGCVASEISLFRLGSRPVALRDHLLSQDLIYVGGGSMVNMLAVWEAHDLGSILRIAWDNGIVICGQSAGAMCWFEVGVSRGSGRATAAAGLGVLPGSCCAHYHSEADRRRTLMEAIETGIPDGYGIDDHAAMLWTDHELTEVYSAQRGATVHRVEWCGGRVVETALEATELVAPVAERPEADQIAEFRRARRLAGGRVAAGR